MFLILLLSAAGFTAITTEFVIVGLLPSLSSDLDVPISRAGLLVTLFAFVVAITGPFITPLFTLMDRRKLFAGAMSVFGISNLLAAWSVSFELMAVSRLLAALALPVFWSHASETAVRIAGPDKAGHAVSMINLGIICASVLGIPLGAFIAQALNWRWAFAVLAALSFLKALTLLAYFPKLSQHVQKNSLAQQFVILRSPTVLAFVLVTTLVFTGMFTAYTYLAELLGKLTGLQGDALGWSLVAFGMAGIVGNMVGGRLIDRYPLGALLLFSSLMAISQLALTSSLQQLWTAVLILGSWSVAQAALFIACQVSLLRAAPQAAAFAVSLEIAGANLGIGLGAILGGYVIDNGGIEQLGYVSAAVMGTSILLVLVLLMENRAQIKTA